MTSPVVVVRAFAKTNFCGLGILKPLFNSLETLSKDDLLELLDHEAERQPELELEGDRDQRLLDGRCSSKAAGELKVAAREWSLL